MSISIVRNHFLETVKGVMPGVRIVAEGENFTPKGMQDYPFIRFSILPRQTTTRDISASLVAEEAGMTAMTIYFSRNTNTIDTALTMAETIKNAFPVQTTVIDNENQLFVFDPAWIEAARHEDNVFGVPVFVRWVNLT